MSTVWRAQRGHHAKKRPHEYQLPKPERQRRRTRDHPDPEPQWDRVGDGLRE